MSDQMPLVSVVMPVKDGAKTIEVAINSVLAQDNLLELIVVNDSSVDETANIVSCMRDDRIKLIPSMQAGVSGTLNTGFLAARGEFVALCDADDFFSEGRLRRQVEFLRREPGYVAVSSGFTTISPNGRKIADLACNGSPRDVTRDLLGGRTITSFCSYLTRRQIISSLNGMRCWFETGGDIDLQFRIAQAGRVWHDTAVGYFYRLHDASITHSRPKETNIFYESCARTFLFQRIQNGTDDLEEGSPPRPPNSTAQPRTMNSAALHIAGQLEGRAWQVFGQQGLRHALPLMLRSVSHAPADRSKWSGLGAMILKGALQQGGRGDDRE